MNRTEFLLLEDTNDFIRWLTLHLPTLPIHLKVLDSDFVPKGIDCHVEGIEAVQALYQWKGDWQTVSFKLRRMRLRLRLATLFGSESATHEVCKAILTWGGVDGAEEFLELKRKDNDLIGYLKRTARLLALDQEQRLRELTKDQILRFDAGMTKIHAIFDKTGSPIFDGRVGAAISMLYLMYRKHRASPLPPALSFAWGPGRGHQIRNPRHLGLGYDGTPQLSTKSRHLWAKRQLQLGWIIRAVLENSKLFAHIPRLTDRCHAFEAGLFMMGYDLRCMIPNGFSIEPPPKQKDRRRQRAIQK